jgi:hypothetical protein
MGMAHRRPRYDPDERFSLYPETGEDVLRTLLETESGPVADGEEVVEDPPEGS